MRKTQTGWVIIITFSIIVLCVLIFDPNKTSFCWIAAICGVSLINFYKLTIQVSEKNIQFFMGIGLISKKISIDDIVSCKAVSYIPTGWGIRLSLDTTTYNVSGNKAIELVLKNKKRKLCIGTNCPDEIAAYIQLMVESRKKEHSTLTQE